MEIFARNIINTTLVCKLNFYRDKRYRLIKTFEKHVI